MAEIQQNKHNRDQALAFQGFLNDLQDWEHSLKEKEKKIKSQRSNERSVANGITNKAKQYEHFRNSGADIQFSSSLSTDEVIPDAASEKELGNEHYKQKEYAKAIECYSRSIGLSPTAVAFANRGMAYLKMKKFKEAENDCTEALNLDDRYVKAYSRRATARKELGKLKESMEDADFAVSLDPNDKELRKLYTEVKALCDKGIRGKASGGFGKAIEGKKESKNSKIKVQGSLDGNGKGPVKSPHLVEEMENRTFARYRREEQPSHGSLGATCQNSVTDSSKVGSGCNKMPHPKASTQELAAQATARAIAAAAKNITTPTSAYQFEVEWRSLSNDPMLQARLLKTIHSVALPQLFKNALSAPILIGIIKCIATFFVEEVDLAISFLYYLTQVSRFDMIILCLSSQDKADLQKTWDEVFCSGSLPMHHAEKLTNLHSKFFPRRS